MMTHYANKLEEDLLEVKRQLLQAKGNVCGLVAMNDELKAQIASIRIWMSHLVAETTIQMGEIRSHSFVGDQKDRLILELRSQLKLKERP
jgi:hypothetical protein